jgi:hypothetical protein
MTPKRQAQNTLRQFVVWGFAIGLLGGLIMNLTWPATQVGTLGDVEETGNQIAFMIGVLFAWVGNVLLLVGLIGWGVKFGRDASAGGEVGS